MTRLEQQVKFLVEIDKVKNIFRQTYLADSSRKENDAEHSWHLAIAAFLLKEHMKEEVDLLKVIIMVLIHDLVEMIQEQPQSGRERRKVRTVFSECCRKIRGDISGNFGKNLKRMKAQMQNLRIFSIISSLYY